MEGRRARPATILFRSIWTATAREEFIIGYSLWNRQTASSCGRTTPQLKDHADGISVGNFAADPKAPPRVYICGSDEGFIVFDRARARSSSSAARRPRADAERRQVPARHAGPADLRCQLLAEPGHRDAVRRRRQDPRRRKEIDSGIDASCPVNWRGDGQEFALLSANVREGGMIDGQLRRVVMFPDDGHPDLAYHVADVTGDSRDEIILWDQQRVWIYTQDRPAIPGRMEKSMRRPESRLQRFELSRECFAACLEVTCWW